MNEKKIGENKEGIKTRGKKKEKQVRRKELSKPARQLK